MQKSFLYYSELTKKRAVIYWGFRLLPKEKRLGCYTLYALNRVLDDIVDESPKTSHTNSFLKDYCEFTRECFQSKSYLITQKFETYPWGPALQHVIQNFHVPQEYFESMMEG